MKECNVNSTLFKTVLRDNLRRALLLWTTPPFNLGLSAQPFKGKSMAGTDISCLVQKALKDSLFWKNLCCCFSFPTVLFTGWIGSARQKVIINVKFLGWSSYSQAITSLQNKCLYHIIGQIMANSLGKVYGSCLITCKHLRMTIKQNFKNLNTSVHLQKMSVFFPKCVFSFVE